MKSQIPANWKMVLVINTIFLLRKFKVILKRGNSANLHAMIVTIYCRSVYQEVRPLAL